MGLPSQLGLLEFTRFIVAIVVTTGLAPVPPASAFQQEFADCADCHVSQAEDFAKSVHHGAVVCQECHGGERKYPVASEDLQRMQMTSSAPSDKAPEPRPHFDHGPSFRGKATRSEVPERCGTCHADVARMNPYGLPTDQLASYWLSNHGKRLKQENDDRVAVCVDCHGVHDILRSSNPESRTFFRNVPATCGRCHADQKLMSNYNLSHLVVDQYRSSVHGRNLLDGGDAGSPHCATCHGNHAAAPPGFLQVGHVCGKCHRQIEDYFMESVHGKFPVMTRCIGCHAPDGHRANHQIVPASPPITQLQQIYESLEAKHGAESTALRDAFIEKANEAGGPIRLDIVCGNCHGKPQRDPHAMFFEKSDRQALEFGRDLGAMLSSAQFEVARTAARIDAMARGVLLVREESLRLEDAKTEATALSAYMHTLNREEIEKRCRAVTDLCEQINAQLDQKAAGLTRRRITLGAFWPFAVVFAILMYRKHLQLKRSYSRQLAAGSTAVACLPDAGRRRWLDIVLGSMGGITILGLLWPAVAYVLPARRRGGGSDKVAAGKEAGWAEWEAKKVSVGGKPTVVLRTPEGFRAYSAVCTHLGCIVHWDGPQRKFLCPCHAATFDAAGQVVAGPPPRPLPEYVVQVAQGEVYVTRPVEG